MASGCEVGTNMALFWVPKSTKIASWRRLGGILGRLGGVLEVSWGVLEASWSVLEASWRHLGTSWRSLGASWRRLGGVLEVSWRHFGASWKRLGASWARLKSLGAVSGRLGGVLGHQERKRSQTGGIAWATVLRRRGLWRKNFGSFDNFVDRVGRI